MSKPTIQIPPARDRQLKRTATKRATTKGDGVFVRAITYLELRRAERMRMRKENP